MKSRKKFKIKPGDSIYKDSPEIHIVGTGRLTYIWIGGDKVCFGHLSGQKTLEALAKNILKSIKNEGKVAF